MKAIFAAVLVLLCPFVAYLGNSGTVSVTDGQVTEF